ncbi:MAG TPA: ABC transporter substrate-binding protein [Actinomycetota bacterium]|nr:ABC transporter substrate-binding protein [Actinomycetota bacterium]
MIRRVAALAVGAAVVASCVEAPPASQPSPTPSPPSPRTPSPARTDGSILVPLISERGTERLVDGIETAVRQVNATGGIAGRRLQLVPASDLRFLRDPQVPAAVVVGAGERLTRSRPLVEAAGDPVIVVGDDLYSTRRLYRSVFQASIPELWQARALARLLVRDLRVRDVRLALGDPDTRAAYGAAFAEEGAALGAVREVPAASEAGAVVIPGRPREVGPIVRRIAGLRDPPLIALSAEGLGISMALPPGTLAPYHYAWSGWAQAVPRARRFRRRFERMHGRLPEALEQEGYDAVRILAEALRSTGGGGGEELIRALEAVRDRAYSSLPLRLGPDDHVLLPQGQLGVFAVARSGTEAPGEALAENPWRPVMRTFTYNGERVTIVRRDLRVFFPRWRYPEPAPEFQRSRLGITSPAGVPSR